ncbi:MAG: aminotransferase class I/II-fold pyridoxal phosphate-dependent enzyme [Clostridia bacterium]|nr:aminotransferase class I/II-fold pyridoxal phosphate-dependent enzyme [Clostridia bacterium]
MNPFNVTENRRILSENPNTGTLFNIMRAYGDTPAALWLENGEERSMSFAGMTARADDYAAVLRSRVPERCWVAIAVDTCVEWPAVYWGASRSGHDVLLLDAASSDEMVQSLMDDAGCAVLITAKTRRLPAKYRQIAFSDIISAPHTENYEPVRGRYTAMCTSGTTGRSRVFVYDEETLCRQALSSVVVHDENRRFIGDGPRRFLAFLPFHHVLGFMANVIWGAYLGMTNIFLKDRTPDSIRSACAHFKPELVVVVPLVGTNLCRGLEKELRKQSVFRRGMFRVMKGFSLALQTVAPDAGLNFAMKKMFRSVDSKLLGDEIKCVIFGGSHAPKEVLRTMNALGYYTTSGFGMTETAITSFEMSMSLRKRLSGSVGKPLSTIEYRVLDADGNPSSGGEMSIRGSSIHSGRMSGGKLLPPDTVDGWYATGDIVSMDKDGHIFIEGRLKDVIINESGENIYPDDLEDSFSALRDVDQLCVLGVQRSRRNQNEDVTLVMNVGERYGDDAFLDDLADRVARLNAKQPVSRRLNRTLVTNTALPLVNGIKVKRIELKRMLADNALAYKELDLHARSVGAETVPVRGTGKAVPDEEIIAKVRGLFAETLDIPESSISDTANFVDDLQGDSLQVLSMALRAEEEWGITIPAEEYGSCATVNDMSAMIAHLLSGETQSASAAERVPVKPVTRFEDTEEYQHFVARQQALIGTGDNPYFVCHESPLLDTGIIDGKEVLEFGSYNYIGMSGRREVKEAAKAAIDKYGTSCSGSRLLAGEKQIHKELEAAIAAWKHTEDAIVCVGGHSTNVTFVGNFCGKKDLILYDALAHNSIEQGCRLSEATARPFPHSDIGALETILKAQRSYYEKVLIVIEGAYSMDGDIAPLPEFVRVKKEYGCFLMVDEAHSACVIGKNGGGVDEYFGLAPDDIDIKYGTLSKGLGTCGGYLAGKKCLIEYLRYNMPGFVFSVGISPALAAASLEAIRLLQRDPSIMEGMRTAIKAFADSARRRRLDICLAGETAVLPVLVGRDEDAWLLSNELKKRGVSVPPAMYPAVPKGKARLRFCVISEHKPEQIERALDILEQTAKDFGIELPRRDY